MNEQDAIKQIAEKYRNDGYLVLVDPNAGQIPFDIFGFRPDLICMNNDEKLLVEVKTKKWKGSFEKYKSIADIVSKQTGWRFVMVVAEDYIDNDISIPKTAHIDPEIINLGLKKANALSSNGVDDYALLALWNVLIYIMRAKSATERYATENLNDIAVIKHLYSQGDISNDEYQEFLSYSNMRTQAVHAIQTNIQEEDVTRLMMAVLNLQKKWYPETMMLKK